MLEDDPYGLVRFEGEAPPTLFELDGGERVIYASSFSKTVAPGARVGYFVLPATLLAELESTIASTYISPALLGQATVYEFVRRERFEPNWSACASCCARGATRCSTRSTASWRRPRRGGAGPKGGYFVWLERPGVDTRELLAARRPRASSSSRAPTSAGRRPRRASPTASSRPRRSRSA